MAVRIPFRFFLQRPANYGFRTCSLCQRSFSSAITENEIAVPAEASPIAPKPLLFHRQLQHLNNINLDLNEPRQSWVENFDGKKSEKRGLIELHPRIFGCFPRPDLIEDNIQWQRVYRQIDWLSLPSVKEMTGHNKKPWPQKGTGRARHGSKRSPQWIVGGWAKGPRGPTTSFYMLNFHKRVVGLASTFAAKFAQNDLKIVDTLEDFPSDDPEYLKDMMEKRKWGPSALISDSSDIFPMKLSLAAEGVPHINLMPVYGLNVYSMLKHETLIITVAALEQIEERLVTQLRRTDLRDVSGKYQAPDPTATHSPLNEMYEE